MLVKIARKVVDGMPQGLKGLDLNKAIIALGYAIDTPDFNAIANEYAQHVWSDGLDELVGDAPKAKASPKAKATPKAKAKAAPKAKAKAEKKPKGPTIASETVKLILAGKNNADAAAALLKLKTIKVTSKNPETCVAWYRAQMKKFPKKYGVNKSAVPASESSK